MNNNEKAIKRLLRDIGAYTDDEIQCDETILRVLWSADAVLSDVEARQRYQRMWRHMQMCDDCAAEYRDIMQLTRMEAAGDWVTPETLPPLPAADRPSLLDRLKDAWSAAFTAFEPQLVPVMRGGERTLEPDSFAPADVVINDQLTIELSVDRYEDAPTHRKLNCALVAADGDSVLEGIQLTLERQSDGRVPYQAQLDPFGETTFTYVVPDVYTLHGTLDQQPFAITDLVVP